MTKPFISDSTGKDYLKLIYKAPDNSDNWLFRQLDAVIQTDLHFNIQCWNIAAEKLYGKGDAIGKNLFDIINVEFIHSSIQELKKELALSGCWTGEIIFTRFNGHKIPLQTTATYLYDEKGKANEIIIVAQNKTETKRNRKIPDETNIIEVQNQKLINQASIEAQEKERNCIGEELHDNVNQILMSALLYMSTALKDPVQREELLQKAMEFQRMALEEIRMLTKTLSSSVVYNIGMKESIEEILDNLRSHKNMNTKLEIDPGITEKISKDQLLMLYRIVQEQTNNIIKHAKAKNISIDLKMSEQSLSLRITDDGVGFDLNKKRKGIGLANILNRVIAFNGELMIDSSPGAGCRLEATFKL